MLRPERKCFKRLLKQGVPLETAKKISSWTPRQWKKWHKTGTMPVVAQFRCERPQARSLQEIRLRCNMPPHQQIVPPGTEEYLLDKSSEKFCGKPSEFEVAYSYFRNAPESIMVGIVHWDYPATSLTFQQMAVIERAMWTAADHLPAEVPRVKFEYCKHQPGWLLIACANEVTVLWLEEKLEYLAKTLRDFRLCQKPHLRLVQHRNLPKPQVWAAYIPDGGDTKLTSEVVLTRLRNMNNRLNTSVWIVLLKEELGAGQIWTFSIDEVSLVALKELDFKPYFGNGRILFRPVSCKNQIVDEAAAYNLVMSKESSPASVERKQSIDAKHQMGKFGMSVNGATTNERMLFENNRFPLSVPPTFAETNCRIENVSMEISRAATDDQVVHEDGRLLGIIEQVKQIAKPTEKTTIKKHKQFNYRRSNLRSIVPTTNIPSQMVPEEKRLFSTISSAVVESEPPIGKCGMPMNGVGIDNRVVPGMNRFSSSAPLIPVKTEPPIVLNRTVEQSAGCPVLVTKSVVKKPWKMGVNQSNLKSVPVIHCETRSSISTYDSSTLVPDFDSSTFVIPTGDSRTLVIPTHESPF